MELHKSILKNIIGKLTIEDIVQSRTICFGGLCGGMSRINAMSNEKYVQSYRDEIQLPKIIGLD